MEYTFQHTDQSEKLHALQVEHGLIREVGVYLNRNTHQMGFLLPLSKRDHVVTQQRIARSTRMLRDADGNCPWERAALCYQMSPMSASLTSEMDMTLIALMVKAPASCLYLGEVDHHGNFLPLKAPLMVGRMVADLKKHVVVPAASAEDVALAARRSDLVFGVRNVEELMVLLSGNGAIRPTPASGIEKLEGDAQSYLLDDFRFIKGQARVKEAAEIAMAGGHHLLLVGPPGEGKTEVAKRAYTICPKLTVHEAIDVAAIWEAKGDRRLSVQPPFVKATRNATPVALHGGGGSEGPSPGVVSLAHKGILMADEVFLWTKTMLDSLRIPLEDKKVNIHRKDWSVEFPADFQLIATANPCQCGFWSPGNSDPRTCTCSKTELYNYAKKVSGPILDRLDLKVWVGRLGEKLLTDEHADAEASVDIAARVTAAREMQLERYAGLPIHRNSELSPALYDSYCHESPAAIKAIVDAGAKRILSTRGIVRLRRLARTCADLRSSGSVEAEDVEKAIGFMTVPLPNMDRLT